MKDKDKELLIQVKHTHIQPIGVTSSIRSLFPISNLPFHPLLISAGELLRDFYHRA